MTLVPEDVRINVSASFPTQVIGANGIGVTKANGIYTIANSYPSLASIGSIPTPANKLVEIYDTTTGIYNTVPLSVIGSGGGTNLLPLNNVWTGTNNFTLNTGMGANVAPDAMLTVNANTAASFTTPISGTTFHLVGPDASNNIATFDSFGGPNNFLARRTDGSNSGTKSPLNTADVILSFNAQGYDGSTISSFYGAAFQLRAAELWSTTNHGADIRFMTTPTGPGGAFTETVRFQPSGGLSVGPANVLTDPGNGVALVTAIQLAVTTVGSLPTAAAGNKGQKRFVSDSNSTTFAAVVAAGGANGVPVYSDGTNWRIG